jgi:salicylate biosynthesis isochorismate synthase/menaquinone-specific isochorismate synthase
MKRHSEPALISPIGALEGVTGRLRLAAEAAGRKSRALGRPILAWTSARIPPVDLMELFERSRPVTRDRMLLMRPDEQSGLVGMGTAWACTTGDPARFRQTGAAWRSCLDEAVGDDADQSAREPGRLWGAGPLALCGFSFAPEGPTGPEWDGYPAGAAVLPRLTVSTLPDASRLVFAVMVGPEGISADVEEEVTAGLRILADALDRGTPGAEVAIREPAIREPAIGKPAIEELPSAEDWRAAVRRAAA